LWLEEELSLRARSARAKYSAWTDDWASGEPGSASEARL
jgi:hypothetical protein